MDMIVRPVKTRIFKEGELLLKFVTDHIRRVPEGAIVVITSKIVALSERRTVFIAKDDAKARERLIKNESQWAIKTKFTWLTIKDGMVMSSAGIDRSNANGKTILLPKDSFASASKIRRALKKKYQVKKLGVLITDTRLFPLRAGVMGVALGYAGFKGVLDNRGKKDLFGRPLKMSRVDLADGLATAAVLTMGEADERQPLAIISDPPVHYVEQVRRSELIMDFRDDIHYPLFKNLDKIKLKKIKGPW
jgi:dihydrofolate synthase / folylpolyglutamate synthase